MNSFLSYFGLRFNPFDKQELQVKDLFLSRDFESTQGRLNYLKDVRGIGVFTSRPGMGKTFALRSFAQSLNPNLFHMDYICLSTVSVSEFYKQFCELLGVSNKGGKPAMFRAIQQQIFYLFKEKRQPLLLAVDEAQYLSTAILNDFKMLMNYHYDSLNCFSLILCGESHLNDILRKPVHEALRQRIIVHYEFLGLSDAEIPEYVRHKISVAGGAHSLIDEPALSAVHSLSQGNPRIIDALMTDALTIAAQSGKSSIDSDSVLAAADNRSLA